MGKTILAVDDERVMLDLYRRLLADTGCSLTTAGSVAEAESLIEKNSYDLLITDLMLPDGRGTRLIELLREKNAGTKSLLVTGCLTPEVRRQAGKLNLTGCFAKPVRLEAFLAAVKAALAA